MEESEAGGGLLARALEQLRIREQRAELEPGTRVFQRLPWGCVWRTTRSRLNGGGGRRFDGSNETRAGVVEGVGVGCASGWWIGVGLRGDARIFFFFFFFFFFFVIIIG
jgi:hypothetical protein